MAITIKKEEGLNLNIDYPKLMQNESGHIFYMVRENYGLPLTENEWNFEAENFADFSKTGYIFTDYNKPVTIENII